MTPSELRRFCQLDWPTFGVGWPDIGTFDVRITQKVWNTVTGIPGHPDQFPYIDRWLELTQDPPGWLKMCVQTSGLKLMLATPTPRAKKVSAPPVLPPVPEDEIPPPYAPGEGEEPDSTSQGPQTRRRGGQGQTGGAVLAPLREAPPLGPQRGAPFLVYMPFNTSDLYNWKHQNPSFSQDPQALTGLLESVFQTHKPNWDDCQQLLTVLFTTEERDRIRLEARKLAAGPGGSLEDQRDQIEDVFPSRRPAWDPNSGEGRRNLERYHQLLMGGMQQAARKPINLSKVTEVVQGPRESPAEYLERLLTAYRRYTPIDPDAPENLRAVNVTFITQAWQDIRKKIQKKEGFAGMNRTQLLEIAQNVYNNRELDDGKKATARIVVAALREAGVQGRGRGRGKPPPWSKHPGTPPRRGILEKDQCAYCRQKGHWKNECPEKEKSRAQPTPQLLNLDEE